MLKRSFTKLAVASALAFSLVTPVMAAGEAPKPPAQDWPHSGPFGTYDKAALQRGFQVYREVCAACHGMYYTHFRDLAGLGYDEDEIKAIAREYTVSDMDGDGEMFDRPGEPKDKLPRPFANDRQAVAAHGVAPPDLSLIVDARAGGADYIYALLTGYEDRPDGSEKETYYNKYFPGHEISMAPPLSAGQVEYADGTEASLHQMSMDLTQFLAWASEPNMEERKQLGVSVMLFLLFFTTLMYLVKQKLWAEIKNPKAEAA